MCFRFFSLKAGAFIFQVCCCSTRRRSKWPVFCLLKLVCNFASLCEAHKAKCYRSINFSLKVHFGTDRVNNMNPKYQDSERILTSQLKAKDNCFDILLKHQSCVYSSHSPFFTFNPFFNDFFQKQINEGSLFFNNCVGPGIFSQQ